MLRVETAGLHDLAGAYRTCLLTGDAGQDASPLYRDPDLLGHVYVGPYLAQGRGTQLVAVDEQGVAGYLLSTDDTRAFEAWAERAWWPPLRERYPLSEGGTADDALIRLIHQPELAPAGLTDRFPAHLHIDLQERARGTGLGRAMIERLLADLRARGIPGVHLEVATQNTNAIGFYGHLGFIRVGAGHEAVLMGLELA